MWCLAHRSGGFGGVGVAFMLPEPARRRAISWGEGCGAATAGDGTGFNEVSLSKYHVLRTPDGERAAGQIQDFQLAADRFGVRHLGRR